MLVVVVVLVVLVVVCGGAVAAIIVVVLVVVLVVLVPVLVVPLLLPLLWWWWCCRECVGVGMSKEVIKKEGGMYLAGNCLACHHHPPHCPHHSVIVPVSLVIGTCPSSWW
jgi:hypothetical protein